ncbi:hypothetical protein RUM43_005575 [Polyplax serrata]|uniref:Uncharacterized protein n=1 Tax=Polyplax serrata TaxID=468196 RepID=A0AAN8PX10_POLSC
MEEMNPYSTYGSELEPFHRRTHQGAHNSIRQLPLLRALALWTDFVMALTRPSPSTCQNLLSNKQKRKPNDPGSRGRTRRRFDHVALLWEPAVSGPPNMFMELINICALLFQPIVLASSCLATEP